MPSKKRRIPRPKQQTRTSAIPGFIPRSYQQGLIKGRAPLQNFDWRCPRMRLLLGHTLDLRPISKVYGVQDLYRDCRNTENVNAVEEKLSTLEANAAEVIKDLHDVIPTNKFSVKRRRLEELRRFRFIMHYRLNCLKDTYFDKNHPENAWSKSWIEKYKALHGWRSPAEMWLIDEGVEILKRHALHDIQDNPVSPDIEHFPSFAYGIVGGHYYVRIWQVAVGKEFVLTNTGVGVWEGLVDAGNVHRIFDISPRIVIVLHGELTREERLRPSISSGLLKHACLPRG
ncbi:hypothetical protein J3A83DRAFT_4378445 [Scleroderma citrinum]